jgi:S-formylglutathione hydrolase FrmB
LTVRRRAAALATLLVAACSLTPAPRRLSTRPPGAAPRGGHYRVFLPPGYPRAAPYPAIYFLHGMLGDSGALWRGGVIEEIERRMRSGRMTPLIIIAPDGSTGYWSDSIDGCRRYETWLVDGLRADVESRLRLDPRREARAVSGISMGGFGALKAALRRPDLYAAASSLSGALVPLDEDYLARTFLLNRWALRRAFGGGARNTLARNDPWRLLDAFPPTAPKPALLLRCGSEDKYRLAEVARRFHERGLAAGFDSTLVLETGDHEWSYWRKSAVEVIAWHAARFAAR